MSKENEETLAVYNKKAQIYLDNTIKHNKNCPEQVAAKKKQLEESLKKAFCALPSGAKILEIGSADGENAKNLESFGFDVIASDVAPAFLTACKNQGLKTLKLNVFTDDLPSGLNGVLCWRVFVHFTPDDIALALQRIYDALLPGGRLMFNVMNKAKHDCNEEWLDFEGDYKMGAKRYYAYYDKKRISGIINKTNYKIKSNWQEHSKQHDWLCFVLEK